MRMWSISPTLLCDKHLLGEHGELHKHRHNFVKHHSITGRISPVVQIEPDNMGKRHDVLAVEMVRRGFKHQSPYIQPSLDHLPDNERYAKIDLAENIKTLSERCVKCSNKILNLA